MNPINPFSLTLIYSLNFLPEKIVTEQQLEEVAFLSSICDAEEDYLERNL